MTGAPGRGAAEAPKRAIPRATYRVQFSPNFGFREAADLAPYLAALGVSHLYAAPFFAARPGSTHGYDGVDHNRLNPELGSEADFAAMTAALRRHGLGMIADFVPNHMGVGGAANRFWRSVLEWGPASPYADWFDIDWTSPVPGLAGKLLVPFLGASYGEALADGAFALRFEPGAASFAVWAHETHELPIRPADYARILAAAPGLEALANGFAAAADAKPDDPRLTALRADLARADGAAIEVALAEYGGRPGDPASWAALDALIARQHWRAAKHTFAADAINYRRFFTISDLAGLRVEDPAVFDAIHGLLFDLLDKGDIDGIRIDHIDGLRDPKAYALRLRAAAPRPFYLLVEKILARGERLPQDWETDGTTGYEFGNLLVGLSANPAAAAALTACHLDFIGRPEEPAGIVRAAKIDIMTGAMSAEIEALTRRLVALAQDDPRTRDLGAPTLRAALIALIADLDVYRTYADADGMGDAGRARLAAAIGRARANAPALDPGAFDFLQTALMLDLPGGGPDAREAALRMQQISGPVMAKGLEDTALYRFSRLIALNEVGSEPGRYGVGVDEFHAANTERLAREPHAMLATSTHDTKRGEDARARIAAISWEPDLWRSSVFAWRGLLTRPETAGLDPSDEYFFFQLLLGAWPADWPAEGPIAASDLAALRDRVQAAMLKSVREAGRNTRWVLENGAYEKTLAAFVDAALDPGGAFLTVFREAAAVFGALGAAASLVQTALKLTVPGVPDIFQGAEFWEQSLVDPDNRRDVDFAARAAVLADLPALGEPGITEAAKLALTARLLRFRRERPRLFAEGDYAPLAAAGRGAAQVVAFTRRIGSETLLVAAALGWSAGRGVDARVGLPGGDGWTDVLGPHRSIEANGVAFDRLPVRVLFRSGA